MKTTKYVCSACKAEFERSKKVITDDGIYEGCPNCNCWDFSKVEPKITKQELKQYVFLYREIDRMCDELSRLKMRGEQNCELYELYENNKLRCLALMLKIEDFIFNIDDSLMRQIFSARYIKRLSWSGVAAKVGGYYTADHVRIMHDRFLNALEKPPKIL